MSHLEDDLHRSRMSYIRKFAVRIWHAKKILTGSKWMVEGCEAGRVAKAVHSIYNL